jgi:hypothetical protein
MDRSRPADLHDDGLGSICHRTYTVSMKVPIPFCDGGYAVPVTELSPGEFSSCPFSSNESTTSEGTDPERREAQALPRLLPELGFETLRELLRGGYRGDAVFTPGWHST